MIDVLTLSPMPTRNKQNRRCTYSTKRTDLVRHQISDLKKLHKEVPSGVDVEHPLINNTFCRQNR